MTAERTKYFAIRDALRGRPASEIRVLCPRGHFIVNVQVVVPDSDILGGSNPSIVIAPRAPEGQSLGSGQTLGDVFEAKAPQFNMDMADTGQNVGWRVAMRCKRTKCRYHGSFEYDGLTMDLARSVAAGHAEYRLTN